jgi:hypothetical protein
MGEIFVKLRMVSDVSQIREGLGFRRDAVWRGTAMRRDTVVSVLRVVLPQHLVNTAGASERSISQSRPPGGVYPGGAHHRDSVVFRFASQLSPVDSTHVSFNAP